MEERRKPIEGYEGLYDMSESGRVYTYSRKRYLARCEDEYGFHIVKLSKNSVAKNHNVFELWKQAFGKELPESAFKGAKENNVFFYPIIFC